MHKAYNIITGVTVEKSTLASILRDIGTDASSFSRAGRPERIGDWVLTLDENLLSQSEYLRKASAKRSVYGIIATNLSSKEETIFVSVCEASKILGIDESSISKVARGHRASANGYSFKYTGRSYGPPRNFKSLLGKSVQLSKDGVVCNFPSMSAAAEYLEGHEEAIRRAVRKGSSHYKGWRVTVIQEQVAELKAFLGREWGRLCSNNLKPVVTRWCSFSYDDLQELAQSDSFRKIWADYEGSGFDSAYKPSLDRINPIGSYTLENVQWLSARDNWKKGRQSDYEDHRNVLWKIENQAGFYKNLNEAVRKYQEQFGTSFVKGMPTIYPVSLEDLA